MTAAITRRYCRLAAAFAGLFLAAVLLTLPASPMPLNAAGPFQGNGSVDIADKECSFWLDFDRDGEGDSRIETNPGGYVTQETAVVGSCEFRLNTPTESTLLVASELIGWNSEVEITREPGSPRRVILHPGDTEIPGLVGGYRVIIKHNGATPRSGKSRSVGDGYHHDVQIPLPLRLLEVTVTTADGTSDRLEENIQSASNAYIVAHGRIAKADDDGATPDAVITLASELLAEGYPQIADRVLALEVAPAGGGGVSLWMWIAIIIAVAVLIAVIVILLALFSRRQGSTGDREAEETTTSGRRNQM